MHGETYLRVPPLMVVEILSPSEDASEKVDIYLAAQVNVVWVVDPARRMVTVFAGPGKRSCQAHDVISLFYPLQGSVRVDDFFAGTLL